MKKSALVLAAGLVASVAPTLALADDAPAASPISYNIGVVSDYRYRGMTQSKFHPALQGGIDYAQGPFYAGTWLSTIEWVHDAGKAVGGDSGNAPLEWDLYGGTKGEIVKDLNYDVGVLAYVYLGEKYHNIGLPNPDTGEIYAALSYNVFTFKVSYAPTNLFGIADSKNSQYYDLNANFDLGSGFTLTPDVGYQNVMGDNKKASYSTGSLTLGKDLGKGLSVSLAALGTAGLSETEKHTYWTSSNGRFLGRTGVVAGVKYAF